MKKVAKLGVLIIAMTLIMTMFVGCGGMSKEEVFEALKAANFNDATSVSLLMESGVQKVEMEAKYSSDAVYSKMAMGAAGTVEAWAGKSSDEKYYQFSLTSVLGIEEKTAIETNKEAIATTIAEVKKGFATYTKTADFSSIKLENITELSGKKDGEKLTITMEDASGSGTIVVEGKKMLSMNMTATMEKVAVSIKMEFGYSTPTINIPAIDNSWLGVVTPEEALASLKAANFNDATSISAVMESEGSTVDISIKYTSNSYYMKSDMGTIETVETWGGRATDGKYYIFTTISTTDGKTTKYATEVPQAKLAEEIVYKKAYLGTFTDEIDFSTAKIKDFIEFSGEKDGEKLIITMVDASGNGTIVIEGDKILSTDLDAVEKGVSMNIKMKFDYGTPTINLPTLDSTWTVTNLPK